MVGAQGTQTQNDSFDETTFTGQMDLIIQYSVTTSCLQV